MPITKLDPDSLTPESMWATIANTETYSRDDVDLVEDWALDLQRRLPVKDDKGRPRPVSARGREFADAVLAADSAGTGTEANLAADLDRVAEWIGAQAALDYQPIIDLSADDFGGTPRDALPRDVQREEEIKRLTEASVTRSPMVVEWLDAAEEHAQSSKCGRYFAAHTFPVDGEKQKWFCSIEGKEPGQWSIDFETREEAKRWAERHARGEKVETMFPAEEQLLEAA